MAGWQPTASAGPVLTTVTLNPHPHDAPNGQSGQPSSRQLGLSGPKQTLRNSHPVLLGCHCVAGIVLRALSFKGAPSVLILFERKLKLRESRC